MQSLLAGDVRGLHILLVALTFKECTPQFPQAWQERSLACLRCLVRVLGDLAPCLRPLHFKTVILDFRRPGMPGEESEYIL